MKRSNPIGVISMFYARPFGREHFDTFKRMKTAGCDFVELLVPEPGELDLAETKAVLKDHGLGCVLAARVNLTRDLASADPAAFKAGVAYLESCVDTAVALGAAIVGGPLMARRWSSQGALLPRFRRMSASAASTRSFPASSRPAGAPPTRACCSASSR